MQQTNKLTAYHVPDLCIKVKNNNVMLNILASHFFIEKNQQQKPIFWVLLPILPMHKTDEVHQFPSVHHFLSESTLLTYWFKNGRSNIMKRKNQPVKMKTLRAQCSTNIRCESSSVLQVHRFCKPLARVKKNTNIQ